MQYTYANNPMQYTYTYACNIPWFPNQCNIPYANANAECYALCKFQFEMMIKINFYFSIINSK